MGGGDLNLKKSWHPSTLRNIERVWKAEQKHEAEKQKIEQLQKELAAERAREEIQNYAEDQGVVRKKEEKLDWMYQGPSAMVNREDYLLGRKIDKTFETLQLMESGKAPEDDATGVAGSSMFSSQDLSGTATVDLANKIREDPLFNIMKKEKEQKKNLLTNPVKMKQLQQMLQASLKGKSKKSKKSKKKKTHHDESDEEVVQKRKKHKKHRSSDSESDNVSKDSRKLSKSKHLNESFNYRASKYDNEEDDRHYPSSASYNRKESSHRSHQEQTYSYRNHRDEEKRSKSRSDYSNSQQYSHRDFDRYQRDNNPQKSRDYYNDNNSNHRESSHSAPKKRLDEKERERLLQEMQENAKWREDQRKKNAIRYREEEERENKVKKMDSSDFMKPMLAKAAVKGSVESRVKQKIFTIQRSSAAMDKNFARRD